MYAGPPEGAILFNTQPTYELSLVSECSATGCTYRSGQLISGKPVYINFWSGKWNAKVNTTNIPSPYYILSFSPRGNDKVSPNDTINVFPRAPPHIYVYLPAANTLNAAKNAANALKAAKNAANAAKQKENAAFLTWAGKSDGRGGGNRGGVKWVKTGRKAMVKGGRGKPPTSKTVYRNSMTGESRVRKMVARPDGTKRATYVSF